MSDTCIVCLGDLSKGSTEGAALSDVLAKSPSLRDGDDHAGALDAYRPPSPADHHTDSASLIAHLRPCGHDLHNECLTPWVERANSCPICRQTFNLVELSETVGGDVIQTYPVEDRTQVADLDPSMFLEIPDDEEDDQPCQACGEDDNEDVLMYCDGCGKMWHTYCVDLQEVPYGHWFCDNCRAQRDVDPRPTRAQRSSRSSRRRTRGQQRRQRGQQQAHDSSWTQVWQSVWDRINLDLDFPYDDDETSATYMRRHYQRSHANRQAHDAWRRRMQVAELHGAGGRFRDTEPALSDDPSGVSPPAARVRRASPPAPTETAEELRAWHDFDQARATDTEITNLRRKKRKTSSSSPKEEVESDPANGVIKRRRLSDVGGRGRPGTGSSRRRPSSPQSASASRRARVVIDVGGPSFLQSLLQEVEESSNTHNIPLYRPSPRNAGSPTAEQHSPRPSSPVISPLPSNHSSPRAMSATPPPPGVRPSSPTGLSSSIQPVFPLTDYSPSRSSPEPRDVLSDSHPSDANGHHHSPRAPSNHLAQPRPNSRVPRVLQRSPPAAQNEAVRAPDTSPTRATMSLTAKSHVQKLVSTALKPHYNDQTISKDEYTIINRDISRMLYDKIGDYDTLGSDGKAKWEKVAGEEVNKAVDAIKGQQQHQHQQQPQPPLQQTQHQHQHQQQVSANG